MDKILINALQLETKIGVNEWEQRIKQKVLVDIELSYDIKPAAESDDINKTINYQTLCDAITHYVEEQSYQLIESLAEAISNLILSEFKPIALTLTLTKPKAIKNATSVAVSIERSAP